MRSDGNPYVGPRPFEGKDARFFFGRDAEVEDLLALTLSNQVVLLYAASGAGKSSLLNAAVVHRLERDEQFEVLPVARVRGLREEVPSDRNVFIAALLASLEPGGTSAESLHAYLGGRPHNTTSDGFAAPRALLIDQFEEIFTAYPGRWDDRPGLFRDLAAALSDDPLLRVVLSIREDFLAQLDPHARLLPQGLRARYRLERLGRRAALRAVREPARAAGCAFADGVAEQLVDDLRKVRLDTEHGPREVVGEFVEPVQLQVAAHGLWKALPDAATEITDEHRQRFGNVDEVLRDFYDDAISAAATAAHMREDSLRGGFARTFITPMGTRGTVFWTHDETGGIPARAVEELDARHLIRAELRAGARWYELTHDRLIEPIRASNRERDLRRRERRRRRGVIGGLIVGVAAAGSVTALVWALGSSSSTWASSLTPIASAPADVGSVTSISYVEKGSRLEVLGDQQARMLRPDDLQLMETVLPPKKFACLRDIEIVWQGWIIVERDGATLEADVGGCHVRAGRLTLSGNPTPLADGKFTSIALSRKAGYAATTDANGKLTVIDTHAKSDAAWSVPGPNGVRYATPAFGAIESQVIFAASDGTIQQASTTHRRRHMLIELSPEQTAGIAVAPDGTLIAAYGTTDELALFDRAGGLMGALPAARVAAAAFSPSGNRLATVDHDGTVRIWRTRPDLVPDRLRLTRSDSGSTLVAAIRNVGTTRSSPTTVQSGAVRQAIPALDPGASTTVRLSIQTPAPGMPVLVHVRASHAGEWSTANNLRYAWATGDRRAQIVAAALTAALRSSEIRYATLQAQAFQGVLAGVKLPDVPTMANASMFVTWCYWQAGAADPNNLGYATAGAGFLRDNPTKRTKKPRPGDLVFYDNGSIAIYVGEKKVVTWSGWASDDPHLAVEPLGQPYLIKNYLG